MIVAVVAIVAIAGSMFYYFVFFKPGIAKAEIGLQEEKFEFEKEQKAVEQIKIEQEKKDKEQAEINKKINLSNALAELDKWYNDSTNKAYEVYKEAWYNQCIRLRISFASLSEDQIAEGQLPALPADIADKLGKDLKDALKMIDYRYQMQKDSIYKLYE